MRSEFLWIGLAAVIPLAGAITGCGGTKSELVDLVCECEHCDDVAEQEVAAQLDATEAVAEAYSCGTELSVMLECQVDKGACNHDESNWFLSKPGLCTGTIPCSTDADCLLLASTCGVDGNCKAKTCSTDSAVMCSKDSDCPSTDSKCKAEEDEYTTCVDKASGHHGATPGFD